MYCVGIFLTELSHQVRVELEKQGYYMCERMCVYVCLCVFVGGLTQHRTFSHFVIPFAMVIKASIRLHAY